MKKMRKILSLALAVIMMMAMSITAFAAKDTATITVNGVDTNKVTLSYVQVIKPDRTTSTGWAITEGNLDEFQSLEATKNMTEQEIIDWYINTAKESDRMAILEKIDFTNATAFANGNKTTVSEAGLYVVNAEESVEAGKKPEYKYNRMAADINFSETSTDLVDRTLEAKKTPFTPNKKLVNPDADKVVEVTKEIQYSVDFTVPFFASDVVKAKETGKVLFGIKDTISGATFIVDKDHPFVVKMGNDTISLSTDELKFNETNTEFTADLSQLINEGNTNRNKTVTVTYFALVKGTQVNNTNRFIFEDVPSDDTITVDSYTGKLQVTKIGATDTEFLSGAEFAIVKFETENNKEVKYYAVLNDKNELTSWTTDDTQASKLVTGTDGKSQIASGFDKDTTYYFEETKAPVSYKVKAFDKTTDKAVWSQTTTGDDKTWLGTQTISDTKLAQLPFTGGMGTTIFTVLGVAIMAIAAALFFASKRKASK